MKPLKRATSVPLRCERWIVENSERGMRLGSARMTLVRPATTARLMYVEMTGWLSVVFEPVMRTTSACSSSAMEFVMAPLPNARASPATVEAWQRRAQWSTLFVPITARANFCTM